MAEALPAPCFSHILLFLSLFSQLLFVPLLFLLFLLFLLYLFSILRQCLRRPCGWVGQSLINGGYRQCLINGGYRQCLINVDGYRRRRRRRRERKTRRRMVC